MNAIGSIAENVRVSLNNVTAEKTEVNTQASKPEATKSAYVSLQGAQKSATAEAATEKLDKSSAASAAAQIAAMLGGGRGDSVQANINGFDAARLLA